MAEIYAYEIENATLTVTDEDKQRESVELSPKIIDALKELHGDYRKITILEGDSKAFVFKPMIMRPLRVDKAATVAILVGETDDEPVVEDETTVEDEPAVDQELATDEADETE